MKTLQTIALSIFCSLIILSKAKADVTYVSTQQEFNDALNDSVMNDSIIWLSGTYSNINMYIDKNNLFILSENLGSCIFTGTSKVEITGDSITFEGFQFLDGNIGATDIINIRGSHIKINQLNIRAYTCYKYLRVREESQYVEITYCNFENRINLDDQNILSILVDEINPGYHKIQYCSFKNFKGTGNDLGIEPIRIGVSTQADHISRTLVEFCYFTNCDGDGEIISSKATENVYRHNTFEGNSKAELVLRHGSKAIVYGNFFLNGKGGVRVREGQDHYIYNNYFYGLNDRAIYLQNEDSDPLDNINIAFNSIIDCGEVRLGSNGNDQPTNVTFSNNIFSDPMDEIFENATGTETWISNLSFGDLGITSPSSGLSSLDPQLEENSLGFFGLAAGSPAIDAAQSGYAPLPQFDGMDPIDTQILVDLMGQNRPSPIEEKDLGCNEFPHATLIQPIATEANTGCSYDTSTPNATTRPAFISNFVTIHPNPVSTFLNVTVHSDGREVLHLAIFNLTGKKIRSISERFPIPGKNAFSIDVNDLQEGMYILKVTSKDSNDNGERNQSLKFFKSIH